MDYSLTIATAKLFPPSFGAISPPPPPPSGTPPSSSGAPPPPPPPPHLPLPFRPTAHHAAMLEGSLNQFMQFRHAQADLLARLNGGGMGVGGPRPLPRLPLPLPFPAFLQHAAKNTGHFDHPVVSSPSRLPFGFPPVSAMAAAAAAAARHHQHQQQFSPRGSQQPPPPPTSAPSPGPGHHRGPELQRGPELPQTSPGGGNGGIRNSYPDEAMSPNGKKKANSAVKRRSFFNRKRTHF